MSDLGHGALCACQQCQYARAEIQKQRDLGPVNYEGKHRKPISTGELYNLVLFDLRRINDLKVLVRSMQPATDEPKGDDLL